MVSIFFDVTAILSDRLTTKGAAASAAVYSLIAELSFFLSVAMLLTSI